MLPKTIDYKTDFGGDKKDYSPIVNHLTDRSADEVNKCFKTLYNCSKTSPLLEVNVDLRNATILNYNCQITPYDLPTISNVTTGVYSLNIPTRFFDSSIDYTFTAKYCYFFSAYNTGIYSVLAKQQTTLSGNYRVFTIYILNSAKTLSTPVNTINMSFIIL